MMLNKIISMWVFTLLFIITQNVHSSETRYRMYNDDGESMGFIQSHETARQNNVEVVTRFNMKGEKMFISFSMQGEDKVVLDATGIREFELNDLMDAPFFSFNRTTYGYVTEDKLVLKIKDKDEDEEPSSKTYLLSEFDTIARINSRDVKGYARLLRSAPITLRSLNLMQGEIEEISIVAQGSEEVSFNGEEVSIEKYRMTHSHGETDIWLLPDGRVYRQGGMFGYMLLETGTESDVGW
ncbi:MAG: hypothetical protein OEX19_16865 [Gammaproteobacteria bacterium]|nr:hypothetical protein [Gammaproteobacteria bacterium]